jgi:hypothetical protein
MNKNNTPEYLVSTLESELDRLGVHRDFVKNIAVFHCESKKAGVCIPTTENGKMIGVVISIKEEKSKRESKGSIFHEAYHTKQFFEKGRREVEDINPVYNELEARFYEFRRVMEEDLKTVYRKIKGIF